MDNEQIQEFIDSQRDPDPEILDALMDEIDADL